MKQVINFLNILRLFWNCF